MYIRLSVKKNPSSEGWFIQSWRSPKAVAIGCTRLTSSGAVEGCQLPTRGQSPGKRCLGEAFISQRYCDPYRTPRSPPPLHTHTPLSPFCFLGVQSDADPLAVVVRRSSPPCARSSHYLFAAGRRASNHVMWARRPRSTYRLSALWVRRCWRAAGREQPMRPGDRSRRPLFAPFSVDDDVHLLHWDIYLRPKFGEFFVRRTLLGVARGVRT